MSKTYAIKEIYYTLQGEGAHSGRPAIFVRFSGCNLWSGREEDRHKAICKFCDTDFWGTDGENGGKYTASELADVILGLWPKTTNETPYLVCTGGEPLLQLDASLIRVLHENKCTVAIETNGTVEVPLGVDWVCMSPKANTDIVVRSGNEIKIVYPQSGIDPKDYEMFDFQHFFIQPMDGPNWEHTTQAAIEFCKNNPVWKLSVQSHKYINIP